MPEVTRTEVSVEDILLDLDNPRMYHHGLKSGKGGSSLTDEEIQSDIENNDGDLPELIKSIQAEGVREAVYLIPVEGGKYRVIEGNRRSVVMRKLHREGYTNPSRPDLRFDVIPANVLPQDTPEIEVFKSKVIWQTGKSAWGAFNVAAAIYRMRTQFLMSTLDIASATQKSLNETKSALNSYENYLEYSKSSGDTHTKRFSFFSKEQPAAVKRWVAESPENKEAYFEWINPNGGNHRLRSVATKGGLRDFKDVVQSEPAIRAFMDDQSMTVDEALEIVKDVDLTKGRPWLKQIEKVSSGLNNLSSEELPRLKDDNYRPKLLALERAIKNVLDEM